VPCEQRPYVEVGTGVGVVGLGTEVGSDVSDDVGLGAGDGEGVGLHTRANNTG
jgi:hypothetical protein